MEGKVALRALMEDDLPFLDRLCTDPEALGWFEWNGFVDVRMRRRQWERDGYISPASTVLAIVLSDGTITGITSWRARERGGPTGVCYEIGLALVPEFRGRGVGTAAHRLLVDHLFRCTTVHRLEALTDAENVAEQKTLERTGFQREGVLRGVGFQHGSWRDKVTYAFLRDDWRPDPVHAGVWPTR